MRKIAFTLAEVLITLAIIGVVAAMTMPTLIANYQKEVTVTQLKKSYSVWSQAFQKILADEGVERLSDTELWGKMNSTTIYPITSLTNAIEFYKGLQKYIKFEISVERTSPTVYSLRTADGASIKSYTFVKNSSTRDKATCDKIKQMGGQMCSYIGYILIDVNGNKKPNENGRDAFYFNISDEGKLYPEGGKDYVLYYNQIPLESNSNYWRNNSESKGSTCEGYYCTARIMENGWKIDY